MSYIRSVKQFVATIKQARIDKGLSQAELGEMVGMSQKKIAMIENLTASPRLDILLVIMSALDLHLIIGGKDKSDEKVTLVWG